MSTPCPRCGTVNLPNARFCKACGFTLPPAQSTVRCPNCGMQNQSAARYCSNCRAQLFIAAPFDTLRPGGPSNKHYEILRMVSRGRMGAVYEAIDLRLHRRVAIKEYSPARNTNLIEPKIGAKMFEEEAQMLVRLVHPNMPNISDYFREGMNQYMVMDFIDGVTLEEYLQQYHRVPESQVMGWGLQIASALQYLHSQNPPIIFRDMKPGNVMLDKQGRIKLIDFGIARKFEPNQAWDVPRFGTPGFAPPEQYIGNIDQRTDVYALGATLYFLLTGKTPPDALLRTKGTMLMPPTQFNPQIPPQVEHAILTAMSLNSAHRFANMAEMERVLYALSHSGSQPLLRTEAPTRTMMVPMAQVLTWKFLGFIILLGKISIIGVFIVLIVWSIPTLVNMLPSSTPAILVLLLPILVAALWLFSRKDRRAPRRRMSSPLEAPSSIPQVQLLPVTRKLTRARKFIVQAIARVQLDANRYAVQGHDYVIQAGISPQAIAEFTSKAIERSVLDPNQPLNFDIAIHTGSGLEVLNDWFQSLTYSLDAAEAQLVEFRVRVMSAGHHSVTVDFYQERRWLKTIRLEFDSIAQHKAAAAAN